MTFLFPILAASISPSRRQISMPSVQPAHIAILIPAHNEEALLPTTLASITEAVLEATQSSQCSFRILVGADGCTDDTESTARRMHADVITMPFQSGKWATISTLVTHCQESDWIVLADCGVTWPKDFLAQLLPFLARRDVMGVAPTYRNDTSGFVERLIWRTERSIKRIESKCGGPVSVHGATVCYRTKELTSTLRFLSDHHWLNDDIVIPLCLRSLFPAMKLHYASHLTVYESSETSRPRTREFIRRRRLVHGNIQWILHLWGTTWRFNPIAAILASRRVFRLLWGYWATLAVLTLALNAGVFNLPIPVLLPLSGIIMAPFVLIHQLRGLLESGLASLLAPYYFMTATLGSPPSPEATQWN